ncbi:MAG: Fic family protein [Nanoarchaeota archaeon]|nr:Fic family protein [Nanoarchaeota archaeon]
MVEIKEIRRGKKNYYYLVHSYREGKSVKKKQFYLGEAIPKNIEEKKKSFMREFYKGKFLGNLDKVKRKFNAEYKAMPISAKEKAKNNFAVKFTYNTQRIEGSTLSLKDTAKLLDEGITPNSRPLRDVKEAEAHKKVFFDMLDYGGDLNMQIILRWHLELMKDTANDIAGKTRTHDVAISQSKFKPPIHLEVDTLLREFFEWYNKEKKSIHPVELAALAHLKFVTIHPFSDENGRISRLMMNFVLKKFNFPLLDIQYTKRSSYYNALERAQVNKDDNIFIQWFFRRYLGEYKKYLR